MIRSDEKKTKKVLVLSGFRIFPNNTGGHVHTGGIARSLARLGFQVQVYSLAGRNADYQISNVIGRAVHVDQIETNLIEETNLGLAFGLMQAAGRRLDLPRFWQYALLRRAWVPRRLKHALDAADIIVSDMPWCPPVPGPWSAKPWYLISHNLEHRLLEQANPRNRRFAAWMLDIERSAPQQFRDIFPCAEEDRDFFRSHDRHGQLRLPIIRCGVDPLAYHVPQGTRESVRAQLGLTETDCLLVFSASRHAPNVEALDALREFCRVEAAFLARARIYVLVVGSIVATPFRDGSLIATGRVPEVAPYFAAGDAGLNPVVRGSGANVKLFEYLATRLPIISTKFGVRGTALLPGIDFIDYEPPALKSALERFIDGIGKEEWRARAEEVWRRHRSTCDIGDLVRSAIAQVSEFALH